MKTLEKIFNPVSDTYLVLAERAGRRSPQYMVYRLARSPEFIKDKQIHNGIFRPFNTKSRNAAYKNFEERLVNEANSGPDDIFGAVYVNPDEKTMAAGFLRAVRKIDTLVTMKKFGQDVFYYEICDPPARKLYAFEKEYFGYPSAQMITPQEARELMDKVSDDYKLWPVPSLTTRTDKKFQTYLGEKREILGEARYRVFSTIELKLEEARVDKRIILHEMAHILTNEFFNDVIPHGPHFAMVATQLYDRYFGLDKERYFSLANAPQYRIFGDKEHSAENVLGASFIDEESTLLANILRALPMARP